MLAFLVNQFPRQVDAYFLRELSGLAERGLDFTIYSLLPAPQGWKVHADAEALLPRTVYPPAAVATALRAGRRVLQEPRRALGRIGRVAWGHRRLPTQFAKAMAIVPQSLSFAEDMERRGVRHMHANWATYPATAAYVISGLTGIPFSFSGHATDIFVHKAMLREKIAAARFVVTCTGFNRGYLAEIAPSCGDRVETVYHGVDLPRFERGGPPRESDLVVSVGTLRACKGFDDLIRAIALLRDRGRRVRLEILGEGEDRPVLERLVANLDVGDRVRLLGYLPQEEVVPAYHRASAVVLPAHHEDHFGIPNILIEGLAAGAPVICTELPSLGELVEHGRSGLFVPERDPERLAAAIAELLDDPQRGAALAAEGRRRVAENFDMRRTVDRLFEKFRAADLAGAPA
jgi:colanic acid/amylovoran biosynthesis glycosyltransferase